MTEEPPAVPTSRTAGLTPEVRVIHVDDDGGFVEMSSEFLERIDDRIDVRTETDPKAVTGAIEEFDPHCIVSDYEMPRTNGLELFEKLREAGTEVPFILFTGKGSESIAAEAMTVGVTDYIQKGGTDTYELVANSVLEAVKSRQRKKAVDRAVHHYTALVETAHVPVYLYDDDGTIQYANEASADLFGVDDPETVVGKSFFDIMPPETHDAIQTRLSRLASGEQVPEVEFEFDDLSDRSRRARISCAPTPHHDEAIGQTIAHDVMRAESNRRELEAFRRVVRTALREAGAGLWMHDCRTDDITRYGVADVLGVEPADLTTRSNRSSLTSTRTTGTSCGRRTTRRRKMASRSVSVSEPRPMRGPPVRSKTAVQWSPTTGPSRTSSG